MSFTSSFERTFKQLLPSPFSIAIVLTLFSFVLAYLFTKPNEEGLSYILELGNYWENGLWNAPLMVFAMQMMLMLVLGHTLALSEPVSTGLDRLIPKLDSTAKAAFWVCLLTLLVAFVNWGLGLVFGALFARKVAESKIKLGAKLNYPLIGAAGYSGLMVWHGGLSGSAPVKANDAGHIKEMVAGNETLIAQLPELVSVSETLFSGMNITTTLLLLVVIPFTFWVLGKKTSPCSFALTSQMKMEMISETPKGAEVIDSKASVSKVIGGLIMVYAFYAAASNPAGGLSFLTPNFINLSLLGLALFAHKNIRSFLSAVDEAIGGAAGILIQFPLYFGIMGIMRDSGLINMMAEFLASNSSAFSFPIITFFSAGLINVFIPSGGGQWAVQGPILIQTATELNIPLGKAIMAMAYGDQLTNMLQPFWALPLLGITGLKAKEILPYTLSIMFIGMLIFLSSLILF